MKRGAAIHALYASPNSQDFAAKVPVYQRPFFWMAGAVVGYVGCNLEIIPLSGRFRLRLVPSFVDDHLARKYDAELLQSLSAKFLPEDSPVLYASLSPSLFPSHLHLSSSVLFYIRRSMAPYIFFHRLLTCRNTSECSAWVRG